MADLKPLIRLRRHALDDIRRAVAELEERRREIEAQQKALEVELVREREAAGQDPAARLSLEGYLKRARQRGEDFERALAAIDEELSAAHDRMAEAFAEVKKFELTQEARDSAAKAKAKKREDQMLDEIALDGFRRQQ